jgi:hypothetical protein
MWELFPKINEPFIKVDSFSNYLHQFFHMFREWNSGETGFYCCTARDRTLWTIAISSWTNHHVKVTSMYELRFQVLVDDLVLQFSYKSSLFVFTVCVTTSYQQMLTFRKFIYFFFSQGDYRSGKRINNMRKVIPYMPLTTGWVLYAQSNFNKKFSIVLRTIVISPTTIKCIFVDC